MNKLTTEEFVEVFESRFNCCSIGINLNTKYANVVTCFESATIAHFADNTIHFYEEAGETDYQFAIKLDDIRQIYMNDYEINILPDDDFGGQFVFLCNDGTKIIIDGVK